MNYSIDSSNEVTTSIVNVLRRERRDKDSLWVTDIGKCRRKIWYSWRNTPKIELTDWAILKLSLGNFIHDGLTKTLKQTTEFSVLKDEWTGVSDGLPFGIRGRLDVFLTQTKTGELYPIDWKSVMNFRYQTNFPKPGDVYQLQLYIEGLIKFYPDVRRGKIVYVDKAGAQRPVEIWVNRNPKILDKVRDEYVSLKDDVEIPEKLERKYQAKSNKHVGVYEIDLAPNWQCKNNTTTCEYIETCKPNVSVNKVASVTDGEVQIRKDYLCDKDLIIAFYDSQQYGGL